jgi:hypothetical protein
VTATPSGETKKPVPVFIGDQFSSIATICTVAGLALATSCGIESALDEAVPLRCIPNAARIGNEFAKQNRMPFKVAYTFLKNALRVVEESVSLQFLSVVN